MLSYVKRCRRLMLNLIYLISVETYMNIADHLLSLLIFLCTIAVDVYYAAFGKGTGRVFLGGLCCTGNESSLLSCSHGTAYCPRSYDAGVVCPPCKLCRLQF